MRAFVTRNCSSVGAAGARRNQPNILMILRERLGELTGRSRSRQRNARLRNVSASLAPSVIPPVDLMPGIEDLAEAEQRSVASGVKAPLTRSSHIYAARRRCSH